MNRILKLSKLTRRCLHCFRMANRDFETLCIKNYDCYGFDIDHTLAKYNLATLFHDVYDAMTEYLIAKKGYGRDAFNFDKDFCTRGLILDLELGNFLKLSKDGTVLRGSHGTRPLSHEQLKEKFGKNVQWRHFDQLKKSNLDVADVASYRPISNLSVLSKLLERLVSRQLVSHLTTSNLLPDLQSAYRAFHSTETAVLKVTMDFLQAFNADRYRLFENFFDMPIGVVCAHVIDWIDRKANSEQQEKYNIWPDVSEAVEFVYHPTQFKAHNGHFFPKWKDETGLYVQKCSNALRDWLQKLRAGNKKMFVLTSSMEDFAQSSLQFILGDDWRHYFDLYITLAKKPSFFNTDRNFMKLDESGNTVPVAELCEGGMYLNGNSKVLMQHLAKFTGKDNPKVLFFGDSLRSDVFPAKQFAKWDTVLVLEEIDAYLSSSTNSDGLIGPTNKKIKSSTGCNSSNSNMLCSCHWGSIFTDTPLVPEPKINCPMDHRLCAQSPTLWLYMIQKYATIAVPYLDCFTDFPMDYEFKKFDALLNMYGFYPQSPEEVEY